MPLRDAAYGADDYTLVLHQQAVKVITQIRLPVLLMMTIYPTLCQQDGMERPIIYSYIWGHHILYCRGYLSMMLMTTRQLYCWS